MPVPESCRRKYRYAETRDLALFNPRLKCLFQQNDRNLLVTPVKHVFTYWVGLFFFLCHLAMEGAEEKEHIHPNYEGDAVNGSITNQNNDNKEGTRGTMKESPGNHMSRNSMHHKIAFENFVVPVCN